MAASPRGHRAEVRAANATSLDDDVNDDVNAIVSRDGTVRASRGPYATAKQAVRALRAVSERDGYEIVYDASTRGGTSATLCCSSDVVPYEGTRGKRRCKVGYRPIERPRCGYRAAVRRITLERGSGVRAFVVREYAPHAANCESVPVRRSERIVANAEFLKLAEEKLRQNGKLSARDCQELVFARFGLELKRRASFRLRDAAVARLTSDADARDATS